MVDDQGTGYCVWCGGLIGKNMLKNCIRLISVGFALLFFAHPVSAAERFKVLVVMSYEEANPWVQEIQNGIENAIGYTSDISYVFMDTKANLAGGEAKAAEAYAKFQELKPDGVITVDDNAQSMFVLPYLAGKTNVPIMFCGVNATPDKYGYPTSNISGILERGHVRETIAYLQQLNPEIETLSFVSHDSPSGRALMRQVQAEESGYSATITGFHLVKTGDELRALGKRLQVETDAIFIDSLEGIEDSTGRAKTSKEAFDILVDVFQGPIVGANRYHVAQGALTAVVKTGEEQGRTAAKMLLRAMEGTPVTDIPITQNNRGRRVINVSTMRQLQMRPRPIDLRGAALVTTQD